MNKAVAISVVSVAAFFVAAGSAPAPTCSSGCTKNFSSVVGITQGETARVNVSNVGGGACIVGVQILDGQGNVITIQPLSLNPGESKSVNMPVGPPTSPTSSVNRMDIRA